RQLITDSLGDPTTIPQIFIPYKEVMDAYNAGLKVPDDVTLMWVDDNHGYIRQLPNATEQKRSGGHGIYYHLSYLGTPNSYLWLSTISPMLISFELSKAYDQGIRDQWIINVGDIKPAEEEFEFCMDLAWDINSWTPDRAHAYTRAWAARTFGEEYADEIAAIKEVYYRLGIAAKPEHLNNAHFDYSFRQMDERISAYQDIYNRATTLRNQIPTTLRDAYYQLVEYPVKACADQNIKMLRAHQSLRLAWSGQRETALAYASQASKAYNEIQSMTTKYNTGIASGKWEKMMSCSPNGSGFDMPTVAKTSDVSDIVSDIQDPDIQLTPGGSYTTASAQVKTLTGLGICGSSATVWPLEMTAHSRYTTAPYAEYNVHVRKGVNVLQVRCLPTFPVNTGYDLRVGVGAEGKAPTIISIKVSAMSSTWDETVAQGYYPASIHYNSTEEKDIALRVYFMDPGLTVSAVAAVPLTTGAEDLTDQLLINPDFEYGPSALNPQGTTVRGYPKGWRNVGTLSGNSWGVNQDAKRIFGINAFWASASPLPSIFELSQTISASKLQPGTYKVTCLLGVMKDKMANCRLFANKNVQYYGLESDYTASMLTAGEINTFAGYGASGASKMTLRPMQVYVTIGEGESLKVGIRTSNFKADGTRSTSDNHGWFKVDHFRIERVPDETAIRQTEADKAVTTAAACYDLSGCQVPAPSRRGVYIREGKKVLVK
ncbi:MAG: glycosyl hydrolase 115 family protein, partial [Bacteroidaceae bacterium]|nr:glycosyl hydrolase 115 family protein [Bacteroidaceae bacterium]